jgi:hypothetical protein
VGSTPAECTKKVLVSEDSIGSGGDALTA